MRRYTLLSCLASALTATAVTYWAMRPVPQHEVDSTSYSADGQVVLVLGEAEYSFDPDTALDVADGLAASAQEIPAEETAN